MWLKTLQAIRDTFLKFEVADEVKLGGYMPNQVRTSHQGNGSVYLLRDRETMENIDLINETHISIYLDAWVHNGSKDYEDGYEDITALERRVERALEYFNDKTDYIDDKLQFMGLEIKEKTGDLDSVRPLIGVRYRIKVKIYKQEI